MLAKVNPKEAHRLAVKAVNDRFPPHRSGNIQLTHDEHVRRAEFENSVRALEKLTGEEFAPKHRGPLPDSDWVEYADAILKNVRSWWAQRRK